MEFQDNPSDLFKETARTLKNLLETEGFDSVSRAFATAVHHDLFESWKGKDHIKESKDELTWEKFEGFDHPSVWLKDGKYSVYVSQPYDLHKDALKRLVEFCEENQLTCHISTESWYFPSRTLMIEITKPNS